MPPTPPDCVLCDYVAIIDDLKSKLIKKLFYVLWPREYVCEKLSKERTCPIITCFCAPLYFLKSINKKNFSPRIYVFVWIFLFV